MCICTHNICNYFCIYLYIFKINLSSYCYLQLLIQHHKIHSKFFPLLICNFFLSMRNLTPIIYNFFTYFSTLVDISYRFRIANSVPLWEIYVRELMYISFFCFFLLLALQYPNTIFQGYLRQHLLSLTKLFFNDYFV